MKIKPVLAVVVTLLALTGCQHRWQEDPEFGVAVRNLAAAQYVNPDAPVANKPLPGLDGPAAAASVKSYQRSFEGGKSSAGGSTGSSSGSGVDGISSAAQGLGQ